MLFPNRIMEVSALFDKATVCTEVPPVCWLEAVVEIAVELTPLTSLHIVLLEPEAKRIGNNIQLLG